MSDSRDALDAGQCPICGKAGCHEGKFIQEWQAQMLRCRYCGDFAIQKLLRATQPPPSHLLSGVVRNHWERSGEPLLVTKHNYDQLKTFAPHDKSIPEKSRLLLLALERNTSHPGSTVSVDLEQDYPLAYCRNATEFRYYLRHLQKLDWIDLHHEEGVEKVVISPVGWEAIEKYRSPNIESENVFVARWFDKGIDHVVQEGIRPAIEDDCGYKAIDLKREEFLGNVDDRIIAEIRESRFVVADYTGQRQSVYFEAGYAEGLGLPVISTCREDDMEKLAFDRRQQNHIDWETPSELRQALANRIRVVIGLGPHKQQ